VFPQYGVRTEHLFIYLSLPVALYAIWMTFDTRPVNASILALIAVMAFNVVWTSTVSAMSGYAPESWYKAVSHLENYLQPIAVIIIGYALSITLSDRDLIAVFRLAARTLIVFLCINTVISSLFIVIDLSGFIRPFVTSGVGGSDSVAFNSISMGRFTGIINQPMENGLLYSLGLLAWGYVTLTYRSRSFFHYFALLFLLLGGTLAVSKIFLLGGIPLFLLFIKPTSVYRLLYSPKVIVTLALGVVAAVVIMNVWSGWARMLGYLLPRGGDIGLLNYYTSGRFGVAGSFVQTTFAWVWTNSPFFGFGFGASSQLDNGFLEFFYQGGMVSLLCYLVILAHVFCKGINAWRNHRVRGRLMLAMAVLVTGASIGAPALTLNRFAPVFWLFMTLLIAFAPTGAIRVDGRSSNPLPWQPSI